MTERKPQPPAVKVRVGKATVTIPAELLPALRELAPAMQRVGQAVAALAAANRREV